ncbi:MAG: hypothetical protein ACREXK_06285, partial [Gammaproteobacteria bacterium]
DRYDPLEVLAVLEEWEREPGARESVRSHKRDSVGGWQSGDSAERRRGPGGGMAGSGCACEGCDPPSPGRKPLK